MKKIISLLSIILISLLIAVELPAQVNTFERTYPGNDALQILESEDGSYFVGGINQGYLQVMKIDSIGFIEWIKDFSPNVRYSEFTNSARGNPISLDNDGGILAIGTVLQGDDYNTRLTKLDTQGKEIWEYTFGEPDRDEFGFAVQSIGENEFLVISRIQSSSGTSDKTEVLKVNDDGIILNQRIFNIESKLFSELPGIGYIIAAGNEMINFDRNLDSLWTFSRNSFSTFRSITPARDNKILVFDGGRLIKLNANGTIDDENSISIERLSRYAVETQTGNYVILSSRLITILDSAFNVILEKESIGYGHYLIETQDKLIISGFTIIRSGKSQWILKTSKEIEHHSVTLISPDNGVTITAFNRQIIEWTTSEVEMVNVDYSVDGGKDWNRLAQNYPVFGDASIDTLSWFISDLTSNSLLFRVEDSNSPAVFDISDSPLKLIIYDSVETISANEIMMWVWNDGTGSHDPRTDGNGFYWPGGDSATQSAIFNDGLNWGGKVNGQIRVNGSTHRTGLIPGSILPDGTPDEYPSLNSKIFKIRKDWVQLPDGYKKDRLEYDYLNWPVEIGAPFEDINRDGVYTPGFDKPKFIGDETLFYVANDLDTSTSRFTYGSDPIGLEIQTTVFGFKRDDLKDVVFKKYKVINKSGYPIEDMYFTYYADDDLGDAGDDYEGFDTTYNLSYVFNGDNDDGGSSWYTYGTPPPAVGHMLVQGPIVEGEISDSARYGDGWKSGYKNLGMTASGIWYKSSGFIYPGDPPQGVYEGTLQFYYYMQGLNWDGSQIINPITGEPTIWALTGDPVTETGWYEGSSEWADAIPPGDRRYHLPSGPFTMAPGDTQEVAIAILIARGTDNINSITELRNLAAHVQEFYNTELVEILKETETIAPDGYALSQNYPNPFNNITTIEYEVPFNSRVDIKLYDILGREVKTLVNNEEKVRWRYILKFNATGLASGVYFYRMKAGDFVETKKMVLLR